MIKARLSNGVFLLGIDAENVRRLKADQPILISLSQLGGTDDIAIVYGETLESIVDELKRLNGGTLPEFTEPSTQ